MATAGMFDWNPKSQAQMDQDYLKSIVEANTGENYGARFGAGLGLSLGRMFGGQTAQEAEQAIMKEAFDEAAQAATPEEGAQIAIKRLRSKGLEGRARQLEAELLNKQKTEAEIAYKQAQAKGYGLGKDLRSKLLASGKYIPESVAAFEESGDTADLVLAPTGKGGKGGGTGPERMLAHISKVSADLKAGKEVSEEDRILSENYKQYFTQNKAFQDKDGNIVTVPVKDFGKINQLTQQGMTPVDVSTVSEVGTTGGQQPEMSTGKAAPTVPSAPTGVPPVKTPYAQRTEQEKADANVSLQSRLTSAENLVKDIYGLGGMTSTSKSAIANLPAALKASSLGQMYGTMTGSAIKSKQDEWENLKKSLLSDIAKATGLSATQLNSNFELQNWLSSLGSPSSTVESNINTINSIRNKFSKFTTDQEALIQRWMAANKRPRNEVINYLREQGKL